MKKTPPSITPARKPNSIVNAPAAGADARAAMAKQAARDARRS